MQPTKEDVAQAEDMEELGRLISEEEGSIDKIRREGRKKWWKLNRKHGIPRFEGLPGYEVDTGNGTINIRGVLHGGYLGIPKFPEDGQGVLEAEIEEAAERGPVLVEQKISERVPVDVPKEQNVREMEDGEWASRQTGRGFNDPLTQLIRSIGTGAVIKISQYLSEYSDSMTLDCYGSLGEGSESVRNWGDCLNAVESYRLPLHLQCDYLSRRSYGMEGLVPLRSVYMARRAERELEEGSSDEVTVIAGIAHAPDIKDFYKNENSRNIDPAPYSFPDF